VDGLDPAVEVAPGWPARVRPIVAIPDSLSASRALERLRDAGSRIALVIDESGGTAGVLTLDDLVAGIVARVETLRPDRLPGATPLHELESELGLHVPDDVEATTVGGLVAERLGRFPRSGDEVRIEGWRIRVLEADGRGAAVVRLEPPAGPTG
jgi:putative hemolysin